MQTDFSQRLNNYLQGLESKAGKSNAKLLKEFTKSYAALPSAPGEYRQCTTLTRLVSISRMLDNKSLDSLTEKDLQNLNLAMRERRMKSSQDYRKALKIFLRLKDRKKYFDLLESDFLKATRKKANSSRFVNPEDFWNEQEINNYIKESLKLGKRQAAFCGIWLSSGMRPHEILGLRKNDIVFESPASLTFKVKAGKTGSRNIYLTDNEALGAWTYIKPFLESLKDNEALFPVSYQALVRKHEEACENAGITKPTKFYIMRKQILSKFYNTNGYVKACSLAGHQVGSSTSKYYCAMTEEELKGKAQISIAQKTCPNCKSNNPPEQENCFKCQSPLDNSKFQQILQDNLQEMIAKAVAAQVDAKIFELKAK